MMQVRPLPSAEVVPPSLHAAALAARTFRPVADQSQNVAAEVIVAHAHTDWDNLDSMRHKRKDGTK